MLKLHLTTCLLATALAGAPALAQTPPQPGSPGVAQPPSAQQQPPSAQRQGAQQALKPLAKPGPNHMLSSDLEDTTVYGANNEAIGEISDVLIDRNGKVVAVIIGVGGFLGIGEKDVAVPFEALEIIAAQPSGAGTTGTGPTGAAPGAGSTSNQAQGTMSPDRIVLRGMNKSDLESAPAFQDDDDDNNAAGSPARPGGMQQNR
jgi:sporulation protein YlmC with PRC-barrel domain